MLTLSFMRLDAAKREMPEMSAGALQVYHSPNPALNVLRTRIKDNRRIIAACMAFPLPVGFLGVHRIFLGTKPYIPVAYVATFGGCLGIIPFVDFWAILFSKIFEQYINNPKVFMWIK